MVKDKEVPDSQDLMSNMLKAILSLGHGSFSANDIKNLVQYINNNSKRLFLYDRSAVIRIADGKAKVLGISGQGEIKHNSEYCLEITTLISKLTSINKITKLSKETLDEVNAPLKARKAFEYFENKGAHIVLIPLLKPNVISDLKSNEKFFWVLEFFTETDEKTLPLINLLGVHYSEALWLLYQYKKGASILSPLKSKKFFTKRKWFFFGVLIFIIFMFIRTSDNVVADFELVPYDAQRVYAPYNGIIKKVYFKDGDHVRKGNIIMKYNTEELSYNLAQAQASYDAITAQLDYIKQSSFKEREKRGEVKILIWRQKEAKIEIEKYKWYLDHSKLKANISGILSLKDSEKWVGRAVRTGEELFEIVPYEKIEAEVMLNEKKASVLGSRGISILLYLYARPENPIKGKIVSISPKPMLTKTGQFAYIIKVKIDKEHLTPDYIVGMRGIARISGEKVFLGYYLFRNILLWWRKI